MRFMSSLKIATAVATVGFIAVAVLVGLAYRGWIREVRPKLSHWRNGFGLSALMLSSFAWVWYAQWWVLTLTGHAPSDPTYQIDLKGGGGNLHDVVTRTSNRVEWHATVASNRCAVLLFIACKPFAYA